MILNQMKAEVRSTTDDPILKQVVYIGSQPGEPAHIISRPRLGRLRDWMTGPSRRNRLADPRLEALRALSAAVSKPHRMIDDDLITMVSKEGWTISDLQLLLPTCEWHKMPGFKSDARDYRLEQDL